MMAVLVLPSKNNKDRGIEPKKSVLPRHLGHILNGKKQEHHPRDLNEGKKQAMREGELEEAAVDEDAGERGQVGVVVGEKEGEEGGGEHA